MDGFGTSISDSDPTLITDALADLLWDQQKGIGLSIFRQMIDPDGQPTHDPGDFAKAGFLPSAVARLCGSRRAVEGMRGLADDLGVTISALVNLPVAALRRRVAHARD
jgi:hypothetical protein